MSDQDAQSSSEDKIVLLKTLIASEDAFSDNQTIFQTHLSDLDPEVRTLAVKGLWDYPDPALIDPLMEMVHQDPDLQVRHQAIKALGRYVHEGEMADYDFEWGAMDDIMREDELPEADYRRVLAFLLDIAHNPAATLDAQRFAIEALGFSSEPEVADLIEQAYRSPHEEMKASALFAMGRSGLTRWTSYILAELDSPNPHLQIEAVRAAGELYLDEATPVLLSLADTAGDRDLRHEAIWALGHTTSLDTHQLLGDVAYDPAEDEETRQIAKAALDEYYLTQQMAEYEEDGEFYEEENDGGNGYFPEW